MVTMLDTLLYSSDILKRFAIPAGEAILDPWNGVGTTTQVARENGNHAIGFDLNPVAVIVAKARQLHCGVLPSIASLCAEIVEAAIGDREASSATPEPLDTWFMPAAASALEKSKSQSSVFSFLTAHTGGSSTFSRSIRCQIWARSSTPHFSG